MDKMQLARDMGTIHASIQIIGGAEQVDSFIFEDVAPYDRLSLFRVLEGRGWEESDDRLDDDYAGEWLAGYDSRYAAECQSCQ